MTRKGFTKRISYVLTTVVVVCIMGSCSMIRVVETDSPTWNRAGAGPHFGHDTTIRSSVWKGKNKKNFRSTCTYNMSRVKITTKPGDFLIAFFTAGFVVKQHISWDCAQRKGTSDTD